MDMDHLHIRAVAVVAVDPRLGCGAIAHLSGDSGEVLVAPNGDWADVRFGFILEGRLLFPTRTSTIDVAGDIHGVWIEASTATPLLAGDDVPGDRVQLTSILIAA